MFCEDPKTNPELFSTIFFYNPASSIITNCLVYINNTIYNMSMLLPVNVRQAASQLKLIQKVRREAKMGHLNIGNGSATYVNFEGESIIKDTGEVKLQKREGKIVEIVTPFSRLECEKIEYYTATNTTLKFVLKDCLYKTYSITMETIQQAEAIIALVKPPPNPRASTYEHDGNVTMPLPKSQTTLVGE